MSGMGITVPSLYTTPTLAVPALTLILTPGVFRLWLLQALKGFPYLNACMYSFNFTLFLFFSYNDICSR